MAQETIFYSWQSDNSKTRSYVERALKKAVESIADDPSIESAPRIDKDTQDVAGAVHIVDTIKKKIDECGIFLADVSLVDKAASGRAIVNQNVMFELGYAIGKHSESRVIMVANADLGDVKNLPFDISHHRVIQFSPSADPKATKLQASLESAINIHLQALAVQNKESLVTSEKEKLLTAIDNGKPTRTLAKKYFETAYSQYLGLSPGRYKDGNHQHYASEVFEAYEKTKHIALELHEVFEVAAEHKKEDVLLQAYKSIQIVSQYYDVMPEDGGQLSEVSKDYYILVVNEIVSLLMGSISHEKLWGLMQEIASTKLSRADMYEETRTLDRLYGHPQNLLNYYKELKSVNYVIPMTPLIAERFSDSQDVLQAYIDGSMLRYFLVGSYPWIVGLLLGNSWTKHIPEFFAEFKKVSFVNAMMKVTGEKTVDEFRSNIWKQASADLANWSYPNDNLLPALKFVGIETEGDIAKNQQVISV
ncbi:hypothetical protein RAAC3_TM7C00001G0153 [Candidatus Saccharibacteria bacterium RAAC3_TM7_1]|nr:hypothetical protein RAAC3_TM7C00001G0153 [Candidatus Saccharibacteria bacterium RAAC3_TM7_1]